MIITYKDVQHYLDYSTVPEPEELSNTKEALYCFNKLVGGNEYLIKSEKDKMVFNLWLEQPVDLTKADKTRHVSRRSDKLVYLEEGYIAQSEIDHIVNIKMAELATIQATKEAGINTDF
jgi:hypothetical protein